MLSLASALYPVRMEAIVITRCYFGLLLRVNRLLLLLFMGVGRIFFRGEQQWASVTCQLETKRNLLSY